ncbi:DUF1127 domain-containing protein [Rhizobium rosettiformans]
MTTIRNIRWTDQYPFGIFAIVILTDRSPAIHPPRTSSPVCARRRVRLLVPAERKIAMRTNDRIFDFDLDLATERPNRTLAARLYQLAGWLGSLRVALRNRLAANSLADLDERLLNDLGLSRGDVRDVLRRHGLTDDPSLQLARLARRRAERSIRGQRTD